VDGVLSFFNTYNTIQQFVQWIMSVINPLSFDLFLIISQKFSLHHGFTQDRSPDTLRIACKIRTTSYIDLDQPQSVAPGPGCSEPDFDLSYVTLRRGFLYIAWPSVLSFNNHHIIYPKQSSKQHFYRIKSYLY